MKLNLGSGQAKIEGYINIDNRPEMNPDLVHDLTERFPFQDNSVEYVRAFDVLEHIPPSKVIFVIEEIWRVLKPGCIFESHTPDAQYGQGAFQDPGHISFWVENSWLYYSQDAHRSLYNIKAKFNIESLNRIPSLETKSEIYWLHVVARAVKD